MPRSFFSELRRRNVWRAAVLYAAAAWLLVQVATQVFPVFDFPNRVLRWIVIAAAIGFPFWIAFAWLYEITPEGLKREREVDPAESVTQRTGKKLDRWIIGILAAAVVLLLANTFVWHKGASLTGPSEAEAAPARSIAVLPFENLSSDKEQGYFADGISEDLLDLLTKVTALRVAARTSSFAFKGRNLEVPEIARRLHVANVLQGSVRRAGDQVRITAQLVHAADGYQVWSQTWDRKLGDVFAIQDEIASDVVKHLQVQLLGATVPRARQTDPRAYALFLQARELGRHARREALARSDSLLQQVLRLDPRYAPAWVQISHNFTISADVGVRSNAEGYRRAREAAEKALAIDSSYAPAWAELGGIALAEDDLARAARELERALALDPTDLDVLANSAFLLRSLGRMKQAIELHEYVADRDPVNALGPFRLCVSYTSAARYDAAIASCRASLSLGPGYGIRHFSLGKALLLKGDPTGALAEMQHETSIVWRQIGLPMAYHALGRKAESDAALAELIRSYPKDAPYNIAYVYAFRGETDRAFAWLEKAVVYSDPGLWEISTEHLFDHVSSDPRWLPFLRRIGKAPEQLSRIRFRVRLPGRGEASDVATGTATGPRERP